MRKRVRIIIVGNFFNITIVIRVGTCPRSYDSKDHDLKKKIINMPAIQISGFERKTWNHE